MCSIPGINFDVKYAEPPALDDVNDFGASDIGLPNRSCRLGCGSGDLFNSYHIKLPRHDITALGNCSLFSQIILNKSSEVKYTIRKTAYIYLLEQCVSDPLDIAYIVVMIYLRTCGYIGYRYCT